MFQLGNIVHEVRKKKVKVQNRYNIKTFKKVKDIKQIDEKGCIIPYETSSFFYSYIPLSFIQQGEDTQKINNSQKIIQRKIFNITPICYICVEIWYTNDGRRQKAIEYFRGEAETSYFFVSKNER